MSVCIYCGENIPAVRNGRKIRYCGKLCIQRAWREREKRRRQEQKRQQERQLLAQIKKRERNGDFRLGDRIAKIRLEMGLTRAQLADRAGISRKYIQRYEEGIYLPSKPLAMRLETVLGMGVLGRVSVRFSRTRQRQELEQKPKKDLGLGAQTRLARFRLDLSLDELAKISGIGRKTIFNIESEASFPQKFIIECLSEALGEDLLPAWRKSYQRWRRSFQIGKIDPGTVRKIRKLAKEGISRKNICEKLGLPKWSVGSVLRGNTWRWVR